MQQGRNPIVRGARAEALSIVNDYKNYLLYGWGFLGGEAPE